MKKTLSPPYLISISSPPIEKSAQASVPLSRRFSLQPRKNTKQDLEPKIETTEAKKVNDSRQAKPEVISVKDEAESRKAAEVNSCFLSSFPRFCTFLKSNGSFPEFLMNWFSICWPEWHPFELIWLFHRKQNGWKNKD